MSHDYPEIGEAIAIHDALIHEFVGAPVIRDEGALAAPTSAWMCSSNGPGIVQFDSAPRKAVHISCRNRRVLTTGYGRYLAVGGRPAARRAAAITA